MKRKVIIEYEIDPTEYNGAKDTPNGVIDLVRAILLNTADPPSGKIKITCDNISRNVKIS